MNSPTQSPHNCYNALGILKPECLAEQRAYEPKPLAKVSVEQMLGITKPVKK